MNARFEPWQGALAIAVAASLCPGRQPDERTVRIIAEGIVKAARVAVRREALTTPEPLPEAARNAGAA